MKSYTKANEALHKLMQALTELLENTGWANLTDDQLRDEGERGNEMADVILRSRAAIRSSLSEVPVRCSHEWPLKDGQTDLNGYCNQCGLSFQWFIHGHDKDESNADGR